MDAFLTAAALRQAIRSEEPPLVMLAQAMTVYDVRYRWCKEGKQEIRTWNPDLYR